MEEGAQDDVRHNIDGKLLPEKHQERISIVVVFLFTPAEHGYEPQGFATPSMVILSGGQSLCVPLKE